MPKLYQHLHKVRASEWLAELICSIVFVIAVLSTAFVWGV